MSSLIVSLKYLKAVKYKAATSQLVVQQKITLSPFFFFFFEEKNPSLVIPASQM